MEKLRIAFYTDTYLPAIDGVVKSILSMRENLENLGHEVYIFAAGTKETISMAKKDKHLFVVRGIRFRRYPQYTIALRPWFRDKIKELRPDIIHSHTPFSLGLLAAHAAKITGAKLVSTFHTMVFSDEALSGYSSTNYTAKRIEKALLMHYLNWFYKKSDLVIALSNITKQLLLDQLRLKNDVKMIPIGIDLNERFYMLTERFVQVLKFIWFYIRWHFNRYIKRYIASPAVSVEQSFSL